MRGREERGPGGGVGMWNRLGLSGEEGESAANAEVVGIGIGVGRYCSVVVLVEGEG